jgi:large conductance mechanosensitive channel
VSRVKVPGAVSSPLVGFKQFITRGNVVDLAVAVVIGTAFTAVVQSLVKNIFTPLIAAIFGKPDFDDLTFRLHHSVFRYGAFLNDVISFLSIAAVIYFVVVFPLAKMNERRRRNEVVEAEAPSVTDEARLLAEIRDLLATSVAAGSAGSTGAAGAGSAVAPRDPA